jgi:hypothetical protein
MPPKRALLFAEHLEHNVLGEVPMSSPSPRYCASVSTIHKLLGTLSRCFYLSIKELFQDGAADRRPLPGYDRFSANLR